MTHFCQSALLVLFPGTLVIKRSLSRIPSVLCSDWKSQFWLSKRQIRVEKPTEKLPLFDTVSKQNCRSTWRQRTPVAMPMLLYKRRKKKRSLSSMARKPAVIWKIEGNQRKPIAIWRKFVITILALSLDVTIVSLAGRDFPPAAQLPATIRPGVELGK